MAAFHYSELCVQFAFDIIRHCKYREQAESLADNWMQKNGITTFDTSPAAVGQELSDILFRLPVKR
jgi:hypothetical protein